jgi:two-component system LytT family sensor kinase
MRKIRRIEFWAATLLFATYVAICVHHGFQLMQKRIRGNQDFQLAGYLLPTLLEGLLTYLMFLVINHVLVPRWWLARKFTMAMVWTVISYLVITSLYIVVSVCFKGWAEHYRSSTASIYLKVVMQQFVSTALWYVLLAIYVLFRQVVLHQYRRYGLSQTLASRIIKEVVAVAFIWSWLLNVLWGLRFKALFQLFGVYYIIVVPFGAAVYFINLYWLIPVYKSTVERSWWKYAFRLAAMVTLLALFETICIKATPYYLSPGMLVFTAWFIPLAIALPLSWMVYRANETFYRQLTTLKAALDASDASLQLLRSQINPHFLFNTLNALYGTAIVDGSRRTAEGIQQLGDMMRFMLHDNQRDFIPLSSEMSYLKNYLALQQLRLGNAAVQIEIEIDDDAGQALLIAPMLLIPLVENAFKHGIGPAEVASEIIVRLQTRKQRINFCVINSMHASVGHDPEKVHSGIGLTNVSQRLQVYYKGSHQFEYGAKGTTFTVQLIIDLLQPSALQTTAS